VAKFNVISFLFDLFDLFDLFIIQILYYKKNT